MSIRKGFHPEKQCILSKEVLNWIKYLIEKLNSNGVKVYLNTNIRKIEYSHNSIEAIQLNGHKIDVANLYWTAPSVFLCLILNCKKTFYSQIDQSPSTLRCR